MRVWEYDTERNVIQWIGPPHAPTAWDSFIWLAGWALLVTLVLLVVGIMAIFIAWAYAEITTILSDRKLLWADERGRLPVNRQMIELGAFVQAAYGLVDPSLIAPDQRGLLPVPKTLLENGALAEQILLLAAEYIKANRLPQPVPSHLVYSPTTSNDRALDVSMTNGVAGATGGGAFSLLKAPPQDTRFAIQLPEQQLDIPLELPVEVNHAQPE